MCTIDTYLGKLGGPPDLASFIQAVVSNVGGDVEIVARVFGAIFPGRCSEAEISAHANRVCAVYQNGVSEEASQVQPYAKDLDWNGFRYLPSGKTYLGTVQNDCGSLTVLVNADEVPGGELLALDVGKNMEKADTYEEAQGHTEDQVLMIVHLPTGLDLARDTLHKVGTTSSIFVPVFDKVERAKGFRGIVLEDNFQRYRIGGASCSYCHPSKTNESPKPKPVAERLMLGLRAMNPFGRSHKVATSWA